MKYKPNPFQCQTCATRLTCEKPSLDFSSMPPIHKKPEETMVRCTVYVKQTKGD